MTGITGYTKKGVLILLLLFISGFSFLSAAGQEKQSVIDQTDVTKKVRLLKKISAGYGHDLDQLEKSKAEVDKLHQKAHRSILSNVGVVMFKGLAGFVRKYFDTPGPSGLLQDLLQELLFEIETEPEERGKFRFWTKRNFLRRKQLGKMLSLLEQVLNAPLARFDDDRGHFDSTEDFWPTSNGKPDPYLKQVTLRLKVIVHIAGEFSKLLEKEKGGLIADREQVENHIKYLESVTDQPDPPATEEPVIN